MRSFAFSVVNFLIFAGLLIYKGRAPMREFVGQRSKSLAEELKTVRERLERARTQYQEYSSKLEAIESEVLQVREEMRQQAGRTRDQILLQAQALAAGIVREAELAAASARAELKQEIYLGFGLKVMDRVESMISKQLTGTDRARIAREFSRLVERTQ